MEQDLLISRIPQSVPTLILRAEDDKITPLRCFSERNEFRQPHIQLVSIPKSGHFPWVENLAATCNALEVFSTKIKKESPEDLEDPEAL